ncbi:MAG: hypothetical protein SNJ53_02240 [Thermodesulfovibrionales bacterium]
MMMRRYIVIFGAVFFSLFFMISLASASPVLEIVPATGAPGDAIKINGKGFKAGEEVDVLFILEKDMKIGIGTTKVDVIQADQNGNFSVEAGIPVNAKPGTYTIEAIGNKDSNTKTQVEVTPKKK